MLRVNDVRKTFGAVTALDRASLVAHPGRVLALLGENGAGKSTLSKVLSGVVNPDSGSVELGGAALRTGSLQAAKELGVRTVFQELSLVPDLSVAENLCLERLPRNVMWRVARRTTKARARDLLERLGVDRLCSIDASTHVGELDLARRQILEVARAIAEPAKLYIFDEPTSALSLAESEWVLEQARRVAGEGSIVIFISHRMNEVRAVADDLTIMRAGRIVAEGTPDEMNDDEIISTMLGRRIVRLFPERHNTPGGTLVSIRDLTVQPLLGPISLDIRKSEVLGLGGLEGQGQAVLLNALLGAVKSDGEMKIEGVRHAPRSPARAVREGVAYVPQDRQAEGLLTQATVRGNISISSLKGLSGRFGINFAAEQELVHDQIGAMRISADRLEDPVTALSGGNQQKVILARALAIKPRLLLLNDCTRGVDVGTKADIFAVVSELAAAGVTVVIYSSDMTELVGLCDRVAVLREGRLAGILERERLSEETILHAAVGTDAAGGKGAPSSSPDGQELRA